MNKHRDRRVVVLGLDGVPFSLLMDYLGRGMMPELSRLTGTGSLVPITSSLPQVSSVAWSSFMTGKNPGEHGLHLSRDNHRQLYLPPHFAHGFLTLSREAIVLYSCTDYYDGQDQRGICWNDPTLDIKWPLSGALPILSDKDAENQTLAEYHKNIR